MSTAPVPVGQVDSGMATAAAGGGSWLALGQGLRVVLQLVVIVVLARLLSPEDYGLAAVVFVVLGLGFVFVELGLTAAVVQKPDLDDSDRCAAFWLNLGAGAALTVIVCLAAPLVSFLYDEPRLLPLLLLSSLTFSLSLGVVHTAVLEREGRFRELAAVELAATVVGWSVTIGAALAGAGPVALVVGPLVQVVVGSLLLWWRVPWLPRTWGTRSSYRAVWRFGRGLTGFNLVTWLAQNIDSIVVSRVGGPTALGLYNRAFNLTRMPVQQAASLLDRVLLPPLSRLQDDPTRLRAAVVRAVTFACLLLLPALLGVAAIADPLVTGLLGSVWEPMVPLIVLLAVASVPQVVLDLLRTVFTASGQTGLLFRWGLPQQLSVVLAAVVGGFWGVTGVAAALALRAWLTLPWALHRPLALIGLRSRDLLVPCGRVLAAACLMSAVVLGTDRLMAEQAAAARLGAGVLVGVVTYVAAVWLVARSDVRGALALLPRRRRVASA